MKPIAILQHTKVAAPGAVVPILESLGRRVEVIRVVDGDEVPRNAQEFAGLVFMGGSMSVHDPLPWIEQELALIRDADCSGLPVAGHCLGSQLVAMALGGTVRKHTQPELGWGEIQTESGAIAHEWWGEFAARSVETFQWHEDTFDPPAGAQRLASGRHCQSQAFVVRGMHLLIQSHLEITHSLIERTIERCEAQLSEQLALGNIAVQPAAAMLTNVGERTARMHGVLSRLYSRWASTVAH